MANTVKKNANGYNYKYTDLAHIHEWLEENGYSYYQYIDVLDGVDYVMTVRKGDGFSERPVRGCRVVQAKLDGKKNPAQEQGSALTYARRYSLLMAFGLATDDDDGEAFTVKVEDPPGMDEPLERTGEPPQEFEKMQDKVERLLKNTTKDKVDGYNRLLEKHGAVRFTDLTPEQQKKTVEWLEE